MRSKSERGPDGGAPFPIDRGPDGTSIRRVLFGWPLGEGDRAEDERFWGAPVAWATAPWNMFMLPGGREEDG
jgi:hypothetical protein